MIKQEKFTPILEAMKRFTEVFGLKIAEGEWKSSERELRFKTEKNFEVWIDLTADINGQILKLKKPCLNWTYITLLWNILI